MISLPVLLIMCLSITFCFNLTQDLLVKEHEKKASSVDEKPAETDEHNDNISEVSKF